MSSFKRRVQSSVLPGTRPSPYTSQPLLSLGLPSLDDILGGGFPLGSSLLVHSDHPTSYALLLLKLYLAQGLEAGHRLVVVGSELDAEDDPEKVVRSLPRTDGDDNPLPAASSSTPTPHVQALKEEMGQQEEKEKMKIAFRYEGLSSEPKKLPSYCSNFDLTTYQPIRLPDERIHLVRMDGDYGRLLDTLRELLTKLSGDGTKIPIRIAFMGLGSPAWGPTTSSTLYVLLRSLQPLLESTSSTLVSLTPLSPLTPLSHISTSVISLVSLPPSNTSIKHSGLIKVLKLPSTGSLVAPAAKLSVLRGAEGRNDLGFRVKRKRFIIEMVEVGVEEEEKKENKKVVVPQKAEDELKDKVVKKKESVAKKLHERPELFDF